MADCLLEFDPTSEDAANSPLSVWSTASYMITAFNPDAANQTVQWASSVDTEGALPASVKDEVRTISMTIECLSAAALRSLQAKVGKIARERGTLKWTLPNSEVVIFDLLARESWKPEFDYKYFVHSGAYCTVSLGFSAKPYGRGPEEDLGDNTETTLPVLIFTDTGVKGDVPALGRLVVDNDDASNPQRLLRWGVQSRYYSSASTAALFYQAESCAMNGASVATGPAGASGGGSNNTAFQTGLAGGGSTVGLIYVGASSTAQTHIGTFRVFARAWAPAANSGTVSLRLGWRPGIGRSDVYNSMVALTDPATGNPIEDRWALVDLGMVSIPKSVTGTQGWLGWLEGGSTVLNDDVYIDWVMLLPVDEGSGEHCDPLNTSPQIPASGTAHIRYDGAFAAVSGGYITPLNKYEGDYLLIPPAGLEARTVRVILKMSRGDTTALVPESTSEVFLDPGTDDLSARLFVTPRYLVVPSP